MKFVDSEWVQTHLGSPEFQILDPRLRVRYTSGHLQGAIHVPMAKAFGADGRLFADELLARWLAECGVRTDLPVVVYDQGDAQAGAMLAWILEYIGHPDVRFMRQGFEHWRDAGGELYYRPVRVARGHVELHPRPQLRATWQDLLDRRDVNIIDTRSREEFTGETTLGEDPAGHIPHAKNLPWLAFVDGQPDVLASRERVRLLMEEAGLRPEQPAIAYCRVGTRAAVVTLALLEAGYPASLYDGSWVDWCTHAESPIEVSTLH
jgi:thiosulfate/3-mercaptopyruvate sulfurtransferase